MSSWNQSPALFVADCYNVQPNWQFKQMLAEVVSNCYTHLPELKLHHFH
jgi:hypothetical protein